MNNTIFPDKNDSIEVHSIKFTFDEINTVINKFYAKVAVDRYLRGPFTVVEHWPEHIDRLTHFWWMRFGGRPYMDVSYNPIQKHFETGFSEELLDVWLTLFKTVMSEVLTPKQTELWSEFAGNIGNALNRNNELMKQHYSSRKSDS